MEKWYTYKNVQAFILAYLQEYFVKGSDSHINLILFLLLVTYTHVSWYYITVHIKICSNNLKLLDLKSSQYNDTFFIHVLLEYNNIYFYLRVFKIISRCLLKQIIYSFVFFFLLWHISPCNLKLRDLNCAHSFYAYFQLYTYLFPTAGTI